MIRKIYDALRGGDAEGWEVGDWAECTAKGPWYDTTLDEFHRNGPQYRHRALVKEVHRSVDARGRRVVLLTFHPWPDTQFSADRFRKVRHRRRGPLFWTIILAGSAACGGLAARIAAETFGWFQ